VKVQTGVCRQAGSELLAPFAKWITRELPYVTLKMAMTLDGRIGDRNGASRWITGAAARKEVHQLRRKVDAVLVGAGTVASDNPSLLVKSAGSNQPLRVVLDGKARIMKDATVLQDGFPTVVVVTDSCSTYRRKQLSKTNVQVWTCGSGDRVNLAELLKMLAKHNIMHVLCEGGGSLAGVMLREQLVDRCLFYIAGRVLGGDGVPVTGPAGWLLHNAPHLKLCDTRRVGKDVCITATPDYRH
jgi:diaminohydroxyphosphoribosylaminopyrimidine deaminase/5-amino-6-(5-phosphoribosylamino)uracil reductase